MKTRRAKHLALSYLIVLVGVGLLLLLMRDPQPMYEGKPLFDWVSQYALAVEMEDAEAEQEAIHAVRTIGANAVPFLIHWLRKEPVSTKIGGAIWARNNFPNVKVLKDFLFKLQHDPATEGQFGFEILGAAASNALPTLYDIATNSPRYGDSPYAPTFARRAIGYIEEPNNVGTP